MVTPVSALCRRIAVSALVFLAAFGAFAFGQDPLVVRTQGDSCGEDPNCFNRIHPDIPTRLRAQPGQLIVLETRNAGDFEITVDKQWNEPQPLGSAVHPITGPIYIEGAEAGDAVAVTLIGISPGPRAWSVVSKIGFVSWRLNEEFAESDGTVKLTNNGSRSGH